MEDAETLRDVIRETLEEGGYTVLLAANGEEALALAREHQGPIDLLLTDVVMPRLGGGELARQLSGLAPRDARALHVWLLGRRDLAPGRPRRRDRAAAEAVHRGRVGADGAASARSPGRRIAPRLYSVAMQSISTSELPGIPPAAAIVVRTGGSGPKRPRKTSFIAL